MVFVMDGVEVGIEYSRSWIIFDVYSYHILYPFYIIFVLTYIFILQRRFGQLYVFIEESFQTMVQSFSGSSSHSENFPQTGNVFDAVFLFVFVFVFIGAVIFRIFSPFRGFPPNRKCF